LSSSLGTSESLPSFALSVYPGNVRYEGANPSELLGYDDCSSAIIADNGSKLLPLLGEVRGGKYDCADSRDLGS